MKLKHKFIVFFSLLSLLPLIIVTIIYVTISRNIIEDLIKQQITSNLTEYVGKISRRIELFETEFMLISEMDIFRKADVLNDELWLKELNSAIAAYFIENESYIASLKVYDLRKQRLHTIDKTIQSDEGIIPFIRSERYTDLPDIELNGDLISIQAVNRGTGGFFLEISKSFSDESGSEWGVLCMNIKLSPLLLDLSDIYTSQYQQYYFAADASNQPFFIALVDQGRVSQSLNITLAERFLKNSTISGQEVRIESKLWYLACRIDSVNNITYGSAMYIEPYNRTVMKGSLIYVSITISIVSVLLILIVIYSKRFSFRIDSVRLAAENIAKGKLETRLPVTIDDEIGQLSSAVNTMAEDLNDYIENIKQMSKEVAEKEKLDELNTLKSRFLSMTSHELKTPLTTIKWTLDNLLKGIYGTVTDDQQENLSTLDNTVDHLIRTVENLLDLSKIESGVISLTMKDHSIDLLIEEAAYFTRSMAESKNIRIVRNLEIEESSVLYCDRDKMVHILRNLLDNAIKFSPENEEIIVRSCIEEETVLISVIDKGMGIETDEAERIFTPFYKVSSPRKKSKGLGIGLSIVKMLLDYHKGKIDIESEPGKGTAITLRFPKIEKI
ncbi:ATP-binding protein [candidate division KSB1 bacterium]